MNKLALAAVSLQTASDKQSHPCLPGGWAGETGCTSQGYLRGKPTIFKPAQRQPRRCTQLCWQPYGDNAEETALECSATKQ